MDGFDIIIHKSRDEELKTIIEDFEKKIGNDVLGKFEFTEFKWIAQTSVNDYIALKAEDNTIKCKGDFEIDKELHKDKSARIVPIALKEYFVNHIPIDVTIKNHTNIYDFCIRKKSTRNFHYEGINPKNREKSVYNKLIRYYISNSGEKLYKIKNPECQTNAPNSSQVEAGEWLVTTCNYLPASTNPLTANINYEYYIERTERIIAKVENKKTIKSIPGQLSLFD